MGTLKVSYISGSLRKESYNTRLLRAVERGLGGEDIDGKEISLSGLDLPMFDEDLEAQGLPGSARVLKDAMIASDVLIISSPEYNGSLSGALKNAIDWASRPVEGEEPLACFRGKVFGLLAASPGAIGGLRGLRHLRQVLTQVQGVVVPQEFALGKAHEAFNDDGSLKDEKSASMAVGVAQQALTFARALENG